MKKYLPKIYQLLIPEERKRLLVLLGFMFIGMFLETLGIGLVIPAIALMTQKNIVDSYPVFQSILQVLGNPSQETLVIGGMIVLVVIYLVKSLFLAFLIWYQTNFVFSVQQQLSQRLFANYLYKPYTFHLQRNSAELIRNVISEVYQFTTRIVAPLLHLTAEGLVFIGIVILLLVIEPLGALIVMLVLGSAVWGFYHSTRLHITRWGKERMHHDNLRLQHLQEGLGGVKDVKLLGREKEFMDRYNMHNTKSARVGRYQSILQQLPRLWLELIAVTGLATLVVVMLAQGREISSIVPTLGVFAAAAFRLLPSVNKVLTAIQHLRFGLPLVDVLHQEFEPIVESTVKQNSNIDLTFRRELKLANICYSYPNSQTHALEDIDIRILNGDSVGFIGPSGSGKSTLLDVILGLLKPNSGQVSVDGQDILHNLRSWQDQIGYVPQSIYLTDDTLRRNVAFGIADESIDDVAVMRAIKAAQLEEYVENLPDGLETMVGERGVRLSGGQRQRIGIARALYHDPEILVLDEATSALDTKTEHDVMQAVTALQGSKTILIIAHRLSTVENCDRVYKLNMGRLVEEGSPGDILSSTKLPSSA